MPTNATTRSGLNAANTRRIQERNVAAGQTGSTATTQTRRTRRETVNADSVGTNGQQTVATSEAARLAAQAGNTRQPNAALRTRVAGPDLIPGVIGGDGTLFPAARNADERLAGVVGMAVREADAPAPFEALTKVDDLKAIAEQLSALHQTLVGQPAGEAEGLAWREARAAILHLMEQAALRANALGDAGAVKQLTDETVATVLAEPNRKMRDFQMESLLTRGDTKALPAVAKAEELLYPKSMPYDKFPKVVKAVRYVDNDGSLFKDNVDILRSIGFKKVKENADGSMVFLLKKAGAKHEIEMTLVPPPADGGKPPVAEFVGDPNVQLIEVCMHAGYGNFLDAALAAGTKGTGEGQVMMAYQCWSEGNIETMERLAADLQFLSTTAMTSDDYDAVMQKHILLGVLEEKDWPTIMEGAIKELKRAFKNDGEHEESHWDTHFTAPHQRTAIVAKLDRDGDGTPDATDHIFNVVYPKRVDAAGGFDPVVQAIPDYALDGSGLNKTMQQMNRAITYNPAFPKAIHDKLPWKGDLWSSGGFFSPKEGDNRAFNMVKDGDKVKLQLSTRFAHAHPEDLTRMAAIEVGLWLAKEADTVVKEMSPAARNRLPAEYKDGVSKETQAAVAIMMLERVADQQGSYFTDTSGMLDEPWAEEELLFSRYGLSGFTVAQVKGLLPADLHDFTPDEFKKVADFVKKIPNVGRAVERAPTRVGEPLEVPANTTLSRDNELQSEVTALLKKLNIDAPLLHLSPQWLTEGQPQNLVAMLDGGGGKRLMVSFGIASDGAVQAAAKVPLNFDKKLSAAMNGVFEELAKTGGAKASDLIALFDKRREQLPAFEALKAALLDARPLLAPGASVDVETTLYTLVDAGLVSQRELNEADRRSKNLYSSEWAETEKSFMDVLEGAAGRSAPAVRKAYLEKLTEIRGGVDGRAAAMMAALDALPANARSTKAANALAAVMTEGLVTVDQRAALAHKVADKLGLKSDAVARAGLKRLIESNSSISDADAVSKLTTKSLAAFNKAQADGLTLGQAANAAIEVIHRAGSMQNDSFATLVSSGVLTTTHANAVADADLLSAADAVRSAEGHLVAITKTGEASREPWHKLVDQHAGDRVAALQAFLVDHPLAQLGYQDVRSLVALDKTRQDDITAALLKHVNKKANTLVHEALEGYGEPGADAYKGAISARKSHVEALLAANKASLTDYTGLSPLLVSDPFVSAADRKTLHDGLVAMAPAQQIAMNVVEFTSNTSLSDDTTKLDRLKKKLVQTATSGGDVAAVLHTHFSGLRGGERDSIDDLSFLPLLPRGDRKRVAEAIAQGFGMNVNELAFQTLANAAGGETAEARQAFDRVLAQDGVAEALIAATAVLAARNGGQELDVRFPVDTLGLVSEQDSPALHARFQLARGVVQRQGAAFAEALGLSASTASERIATELAARKTPVNVLLGLVADAQTNGASAVTDAGPLLRAMVGAQRGLLAADRSKLFDAVAQKLGRSKDELLVLVARAVLDADGDSPAGAIAGQRLAGQLGSDRMTGLEALARNTGSTTIDGQYISLVEVLELSGGVSAQEVVKMRAVETRQAALSEAFG